MEDRDVFAAHYIAGVGASQRLRNEKTFKIDVDQLAREAYDVADAMIAQRQKPATSKPQKLITSRGNRQ